MITSDHRRSPLLQARLLFFGRKLLRGRARLFESHIELRGWSTSGRLRRNIPVVSIVDICVDGAIENQRLYIKLGDDTQYTLLQFARGASLWSVNIQNLRPELSKMGVLPDASESTGESARGWNSETRERLSETPENRTDSRQVLRRVDDLSKSDRSTGPGGGRHSADHPPVQLPSAAAN
jgi:hypothetical protein